MPPAGRLALLGVAALAVRLLYILVLAPAPVGVGGDAGFYHSAANLIGQGRFLYRGIFGHAYVTAEHPPLFPLVLSVASVLGAKTLLAHRIVGCVIGSGAVVLIAMLARRIAGPRAGWIAGAVAALYPPLVTADGLVMSEPLFVLGVAAAMLLGLRLRRRRSAGDAAALGLLLALVTLTRAEGLALVVLLGWPAALAGGRRRADVGRAAVLTGACVLVLGPWVARNAIVFGRPLLATDSNTLIAGANCRDTYYGHDIGWWSLGCLARGRTRTQLRRGDASTGAAFRYARGHLTRLPLVAGVRVLRTFDLFQPLRQGNHEPRRRWIDILGLVFFYPVLLLAGLGVRRVSRPRTELLAPVAMVVIVSALGWGIGRFRVAADASLLALAGAAMSTARHTPAPPTRMTPMRQSVSS